MDYIENVNVATIMQQSQTYAQKKAELEQRLRELSAEIENVKIGIHSFDGAIQALKALLETAESKEIEVPELEEN